MRTNLLLLASTVLLFSGCAKWFGDDKAVGVETLPVETSEVNTVTMNLVIHGKATGESSKIRHRGFIVSKTYKVASLSGDGGGTAYTVFDQGAGSGEFSTEITDLDVKALYYIRAYIRTEDGPGGTIYGDYVAFSTAGAPWVADLTDYEGKDVTGTTASISCQIAYNGGSAVTGQGIYFGTPSNPLAEKIPLSLGPNNTFAYTIHDLTPGTTYCVTTYATNNDANGNSQERTSTTTFTTKNLHTPVAYIPEGGFLGVAVNSIRLKAVIEDFGGDPDAEYGIMWGEDDAVSSGSMPVTGVSPTGGTFEVTVGDDTNPLKSKALYYFAVYIKLPNGSIWKSVASSTETASKSMPAVITVAPITNFIQINQNGTMVTEPEFTEASDYCDFINMKATVSNTADIGTMKECGFHWGTSPDNLESQNKAVATNYDSNSGEFSFKLNEKWSDGTTTTGDIEPLGTYYWKAFAINDQDEASRNNDPQSATTYIVDRRPGAETYFKDQYLVFTPRILFYKESISLNVTLDVGGNTDIVFLDRNLGALTGQSIPAQMNSILDYYSAGSYFKWGAQKPQVSYAMSESTGSTGLNNTPGGLFYGKLGDPAVNSGVDVNDSWRTLIRKGQAKEPCPPGYTVASWDELKKAIVKAVGKNSPNNADVIADRILSYPLCGHYKADATLMYPNQCHLWTCDRDNEDILKAANAAFFNSNNMLANTTNWARDRSLAIRCVKISSLPAAAMNQ